jgi:hypothetical protein
VAHELPGKDPRSALADALPMRMKDCPRHEKEYVFLIQSRLDKLKRCKFTILWLTRYIPGDPDETSLKIRGQTLVANPAQYKEHLERRGIKVRFAEQSPLYE